MFQRLQHATAQPLILAIGVYGDADDAAIAVIQCRVPATVGRQGLGDEVAARTATALDDGRVQCRVLDGLAGQHHRAQQLLLIVEGVDVDIGAVQQLAQVIGPGTVVGHVEQGIELTQCLRMAAQLRLALRLPLQLVRRPIASGG